MYVCASYHIWVSAAVPLGLKRGVENGGSGMGLRGASVILNQYFKQGSLSSLTRDSTCASKVGDEPGSVARERIVVMMSKLKECL